MCSSEELIFFAIAFFFFSLNFVIESLFFLEGLFFLGCPDTFGNFFLSGFLSKYFSLLNFFNLSISELGFSFVEFSGNFLKFVLISLSPFSRFNGFLSFFNSLNVGFFCNLVIFDGSFEVLSNFFLNNSFDNFSNSFD